MIEATVLEWYEQKRRNPWDEGRRRSFGRDKRPPRQDGEVHAGPFRIRSFWPPGLDESFLAVDERPKGQNGQGQMVPGDGAFEENPHKIPRQIREKREIIGFIHPSFANEVLEIIANEQVIQFFLKIEIINNPLNPIAINIIGNVVFPYIIVKAIEAITI